MAKREKVVKALDKIYCSKMVGVDGILWKFLKKWGDVDIAWLADICMPQDKDWHKMYA